MDAPDRKPFTDDHSEDERDLFGEFRWLHRITIDAQPFWVPCDNTVLRVLQYIALKSNAVQLPWHTFCWNNRDGCCAFRFRSFHGSAVLEARACATPARPGLQIVQLPKGGVLCPPSR